MESSYRIKFVYLSTIITTYSRAHKMTWSRRTQISELETLGLKPNKINELNDNYEMESLIGNIKRQLFSEYKSEYNNTK